MKREVEGERGRRGRECLGRVLGRESAKGGRVRESVLARDR